MDLPSSDQAPSEGPALIPIVENNTERGGESVLSSSFKKSSLFTLWIIFAYQYHKIMSKKNRQSHQRTLDIRWKPNVGENQLLQYVSIFFQIRNSFYNGLVLVQSFTSTQAATCRELQLSLVFQSLMEGSYNPLLLFFQGPLFINFQTGSINIKWSSSTSKSPR